MIEFVQKLWTDSAFFVGAVLAVVMLVAGEEPAVALAPLAPGLVSPVQRVRKARRS